MMQKRCATGAIAALATIAILSGCGDDGGPGGSGIPTCADVAGTWVSDAVPWGEGDDVEWISIFLRLRQHGCNLTGDLGPGIDVAGRATADSVVLRSQAAVARAALPIYTFRLGITGELLLDGIVEVDQDGIVQDLPLVMRGPAPDCSGAVEVAIACGETTTIAWDPPCPVELLLVEPAGSGTDQWSLYTEDANEVAPPITYGIVPAGVPAGDPAVPLIAGESYRLYLYRVREGGHEALVGYGEFTR